MTACAINKDPGPQTLAEAFAKIASFAHLPANWAGGDRSAPRNTAASGDAIAFLADAAHNAHSDIPLPFVCPLRSGGVQVEWEFGDNYLEFGFNGYGIAYLLEEDGCSAEGGIHRDDALAILARFIDAHAPKEGV